MKTNAKLIISQTDFQKLSSLLMNINSESAELLEEELGRAAIVSADQVPNDVVTMNSRVSFVDLDTGIESVVTLVYPHEANIEESKISIVAPVGSALIGLRVGQIIDWPMPHGKVRRLKVVSVISQPTVEGLG